eukprot:1785865-Lingulodinium_polyedra.AAC.1
MLALATQKGEHARGSRCERGVASTTPKQRNCDAAAFRLLRGGCAVAGNNMQAGCRAALTL